MLLQGKIRSTTILRSSKRLGPIPSRTTVGSLPQQQPQHHIILFILVTSMTGATHQLTHRIRIPEAWVIRFLNLNILTHQIRKWRTISSQAMPDNLVNVLDGLSDVLDLEQDIHFQRILVRLLHALDTLVQSPSMLEASQRRLSRSKSTLNAMQMEQVVTQLADTKLKVDSDSHTTIGNELRDSRDCTCSWRDKRWIGDQSTWVPNLLKQLLDILVRTMRQILKRSDALIINCLARLRAIDQKDVLQVVVKRSLVGSHGISWKCSRKKDKKAISDRKVNVLQR